MAELEASKVRRNELAMT